MESVRYFWIKRLLLIFSWVSSRSSSSSKPHPTSILFHVWCHLGENLIYCWLKPVLSCVALAFYLGWRKWVQSIGDYHFKVCHSDIWTTRSLEGTISSNCLLWWEAGHGTAYFARVHHNLHYHFLYIFVPFIVVLVWSMDPVMWRTEPSECQILCTLSGIHSEWYHHCNCSIHWSLVWILERSPQRCTNALKL